MIFTWIVSKETVCWLEELEVNCLIQLWICIASAIQGNMMACIILVVVTLFLTLKCCQNISMIASFFPPDIKCAFVVEYSSTVLLVVYWFYTYRSPAKQGIHWLLPCLNLEMTRWILYSLTLTINTLVVPVYTTSIVDSGWWWIIHVLKTCLFYLALKHWSCLWLKKCCTADLRKLCWS